MTHSQSHPGQDVSDSPDERRGQAVATAGAAKLAGIVVKIVESLQDLPTEDRIRMLRSAAAFYDIDRDV